jgi:hypothetical protein
MNGIHEAWSLNVLVDRRKEAQTLWRVRMMECPECQQDIIQIGRARDHSSAPLEWEQIVPFGSTRPPLSPEVPNDIAQDYNEAASILQFSAKASAALSRRCLQSVLQLAGYTQRDLSQQIDAVLAEQDTRKALPTSVHGIVDAIRNFGNFSAHKITDQTTLQVIDVEPHEADFCLDILDALFDHYFVKPADAKRRKEQLNAKLAAAKKPPAK